jgi:6-phosphogluconolactonase
MCISKGTAYATIRVTVVAMLGILLLSRPSFAFGTGDRDSILFYVGSGNGRLECPIFLCALNLPDERITVLDSFPAIGGAGYLALSPGGTALFATSGAGIPGHEEMSAVASFRVVKEGRGLELINRQSSGGEGNCHVGCSPDGKYLFAANYNSGHAAAFPVSPVGRIMPAASVVRGEGSGPVEGRQKGPHAHQVVMDPAGKYLLVPDLGTDKVMNYLFNPDNGELSPNPDQAFLEMSPGTGPRHLAFSPDGRYLYILGELNASLTACRFNPGSGRMTVINSASIVEEDFGGNRQAAAVRVHPNGRFAYASNRSGESSLTVFEIVEGGGIKQVQVLTNVPLWPRDFNITPDGDYIVLAGARENKLVLYRVDQENGRLSPTKARATLPDPICILFIPD